MAEKKLDRGKYRRKRQARLRRLRRRARPTAGRNRRRR
ncbi:hypothetical protein H4W34_007277 [Actinomadura algeriensis]|uniref:Uncharacterized protein n=1 Tax=Actinomadura algeriensis TaxID=1679523 RepID=A0ABR9K3K8_9ACTN|nr:hypothetical protein [Actinomadura algeriensis]